MDFKLKLFYALFQELSLLGEGLGTLLTLIDLDDCFLQTTGQIAHKIAHPPDGRIDLRGSSLSFLKQKEFFFLFTKALKTNVTKASQFKNCIK